MTDDMPERIAFRKIFMSQAITSGPLMKHPDYIHYVRADRIEDLTEQLAAARHDAKEAEAYAEELEQQLAKAVEALSDLMMHEPDHPDTIWENARATLAAIKGESHE